MTLDSKIRFPGETDEYRQARERLLEAEIEMRRATEHLAAARRALPPGGPVPEDYAFEEEGGAIRLSDLFSEDSDTLVLYSFMYGPDMDKACGSCTSILDSLDGAAPHLSRHVSLAVVAKSPPARIHAHARERGWRHLRLLSSADNTYNRDYHGETADGDQMPMLNVFARDGDTVRHTWGSELLGVPPEEGQDPRHVDTIWPLWNVLDATPGGRGTDWQPRLSYD